jgi:predicted DNA-binding transcriptional regulator AlpA
VGTEAKATAKSELIRHKEVLARADMTLAEIKRRMAEGDWPLPHSVLDRTYRWRREHVEAWLATGEWPEGASFAKGVGKGRQPTEQGR